MNIKNRISTLYLLILGILMTSNCSQSTSTIMCTLKGEVIDRPQSSQVLLLKQGHSGQ